MRSAPSVWVMVVVVMVVSGAGRCVALHLLTYPSEVWKVPEETLHNLTVSLRFNESEVEHAGEQEALLEVTALHQDAWKLDWRRRSVTFTAREVAAEVNKTLTFSGYYWGRTHVLLCLTRDDLHLTTTSNLQQDGLHLTTSSNLHQDPMQLTTDDLQLNSNLTVILDDIEIIIDRSAHFLEFTFIVLGSIFLLINNINMGAQLDLRIIRDVLRRPLGPACGFVSQFAVMPLVTFGMGQIFFTDLLQRLGLFTLGCSPGGIMSNFWTLIYGGDINLSITMTTVSTVAAMGMMPFWMFTLGQRLTSGQASLQVPYINLVISLVSLTIPVGAGMAVRAWRPKWAEKGGKIIKPFTLVVILFFMTFWLYSSYKVFAMMTWQMAVSGVLVSGLGFGLGAALALMLCLPRAQVIAISIETAFQNGGVVFILLKLSLPSPDSDLAALPAMAAMLMTGPPMMLIYGLHVLLQRCGCCPAREVVAVPLDEHEQLDNANDDMEKKLESERARDIDEFLLKSDHVFTDSVMKENESRYGLVLNGMTKMKLMGDTKETSILQ